MIERWLLPENRNPQPFDTFDVIDVSELSGPDQELKAHLSDRLLQERIDPSFAEDVARRLGWIRSQAVLKARTPRGMRGRRGEFGEMLCCALLVAFHQYDVPIPKMRVAITGDQTLPSADALAIRLEEGRITETCFVESKLRTTGDTMAGVEGANQLKRYLSQDEPDILFFVASRMKDQGHALYELFMDYLADRTDAERDFARLFLTWDEEAWTETVLTNLHESEDRPDRFTTHVVRIGDLAGLVDEVFAAIGVTKIFDDE